MVDPFYNPIVQFVLFSALLIILIPLVRLLEAKRQQLKEDTNIESNLHWIIDGVADLAVVAVEQLSKASLVEKDKRRDKAIEFITVLLTERGITNVPIDKLIIYVEKAVYDFNKANKE